MIAAMGAARRPEERPRNAPQNGNKIRFTRLMKSISPKGVLYYDAGEAIFQTKARKNELAGIRSRRGFFGCGGRGRFGYGTYCKRSLTRHRVPHHRNYSG